MEETIIRSYEDYLAQIWVAYGVNKLVVDLKAEAINEPVLDWVYAKFVYCFSLLHYFSIILRPAY